MPTPFRLFYSNGACSLAPHIALEETGAPFEPVRIDMASGEQRGSDYLRINPKGRVPALAVGDWVLTENPAILQFIARSHPDAGLWPEHLRDQARVVEWLGWIASTVHVAYAHVRRAERYAQSDAGLAEVRAKGLQTCRDLWQAVDARLGDGPWAIGDRYSVADPYLLVFWTWGGGSVLGFDMAKQCPGWTAHAQRMARRPAVQRAFEREGLVLPATT
ncbi:glutathione S-transferase family protein [Sphingomonas abaci]|uniref:Glutathione S-transferase n=1 Tax=Sphingomonas abaci TaxID=237611 RepID=A0A7W7AI49_9SPHN|nr:glutathione S-transferase N-terminal domain-containing protein [Sphingomonas abaci]MBB4617458.1 glutathione S-transferase [Sphingomonas abaci]